MSTFSRFVKDQASNFVDNGINNLFNDVGGQRNAASGFNVQNMVSSLNKSGIAKSDHFEVMITGPVGGAEDSRDLTVRADTVDIPGRNFGVVDHKFTNVGPINRIPTMQTYTDVTVSFLLSEDIREKEYFEVWQDKIMDTGAFEVTGGREGNNLSVGDVNFNTEYSNTRFMHKYFDKYIGRVEIRQYGSGGNLASIHTLNEAYPIAVAPIGMNWGDDQPAKLAVTFAYRNYRVIFNKQNQPGLGNGFYFNLGAGGAKFGLKLPGIGNVSYTKETGYVGGIDTNAKKTIYKSLGVSEVSARNIDGTTIDGTDGNNTKTSTSIGGDADPINTNIVGGISG